MSQEWSLTVNNYKPCAKCKEVLPALDFYKSKTSKSGLSSYCRRCTAKIAKITKAKKPEYYAQKNKEWQAKNKKRLAKLQRKYYWQNPEKARATAKKWTDANKDQVARKNKKYRAANKDKLRSLMIRWREQNPDKAKMYAHIRRARILDNGIYKVTKKEIIKLLLSNCFYCGEPAEHVDHVIPIAKGGTHSIGNLVAACQFCNFSKGASFITEWRKRLRVMKLDN